MREAREILSDIASAGLTSEQMALVMELSMSLAAEARPAPAEKTKAALRQERYRERRRNEASQNVTRDADVTFCDEKTSRVTFCDAGTPPPAPTPLPSPEPPTNPPPPPTPARATRTRGARLAEDWEPTPLTGKAAEMVEIWPPGALERELAKFKNYWLSRSRDAAKTDWQRTWINWLISADERIPRNGTRNYQSGSGPADARPPNRREEMDRAVRDLYARQA